jgi:putative metallohydrolase (TIGR04338 family)
MKGNVMIGYETSQIEVLATKIFGELERKVKPKRPRDSQRSKVYKAEGLCPDGKRYESMKECQKFYDRILKSHWWRNYSIPHLNIKRTTATRWQHVQLHDGRRRRIACASANHIWLPRWARHESTMLHELAHVIQTQMPWHGRQFARIYLDLVKRWHSDKTAYDKLKNSFRKHRVKFCREKKV